MGGWEHLSCRPPLSQTMAHRRRTARQCPNQNPATMMELLCCLSIIHTQLGPGKVGKPGLILSISEKKSPDSSCFMRLIQSSWPISPSLSQGARPITTSCLFSKEEAFFPGWGRGGVGGRERRECRKIRIKIIVRLLI